MVRWSDMMWAVGESTVSGLVSRVQCPGIMSWRNGTVRPRGRVQLQCLLLQTGHHIQSTVVRTHRTYPSCWTLLDTQRWTLDSNGPDTGHSRMDRDGPLILDSIGPLTTNFGHSTLDNRYWTHRQTLNIRFTTGVIESTSNQHWGQSRNVL